MGIAYKKKKKDVKLTPLHVNIINPVKRIIKRIDRQVFAVEFFV